jgi:hypothetical protein
MKTMMNGILAVAVAGSALGCAAAATETRIQGIVVPESWVERAEGGAGQAQACLFLSQKLWERDRLESLRFLRRGAELRDAECCREYLLRSESASANVSQRIYARLYLEGLLRKGPLTGADGRDARPELYALLCGAWRSTEPRCPAKARQVLESLADGGLSPEQARLPFVLHMMNELGIRPVKRLDVQMYSGEGADDAKSWMRVELSEGRNTGDWTMAEASAWGGGSDRLVLGANVLAFLVNDKGEPSFRGRNLWICNLGSSPAFLTSLATCQNNRELTPGRPETFPVGCSGLDRGDCTTGVPLSIQYRRPLR